jgi:predicted MPP superfamily phosphohydrolase
MEIIAKVTHSESRAKEFFRFHLLKKTKGNYLYFGSACAFFIGAIILFVLMQIYYAFFLSFIGVMVLVIRVVQANMTVSRILKKVTFPSYVYLLKFYEDKIIYQIDTQQKIYNYQQLYGICETIDYMYFYTSPNQALILSKYVLEKTDREKLTAFLKQFKGQYRYYRFK